MGGPAPEGLRVLGGVARGRRDRAATPGVTHLGRQDVYAQLREEFERVDSRTGVDRLLADEPFRVLKFTPDD